MRPPLALLAAAALLACVRLPLTEPQPNPTAREGAWGAERARFTRSGKIYDGLATNAFVSAVYEPAEVREARVDRLATWRALTAPEREALLASERADAARYEEFLVSLFTTDRADNDLDTRRSIWHVALVVPGGGEVLPEKIELQRIDANVRELYPNVGDFDAVYRVRFPKQPEPLVGRPFTLRLAGARGRVDLDYGAPPQATR
ncbi:hypothetical protein [Anaeromyxobacter diazotrophicus]|uniref:Lipoprotein n=1 Tax=Anaeromyxobacter diazotrophicus TaxID=2590199 RepID=A0A7I9VH88_9BACT|nr:hypothetical protein [Anaeromyxobacter diazotrophicus]GEJ55500.1 hypothetical protein AMYX_02410 [Anaeromyxobacter diazotrophicus]